MEKVTRVCRWCTKPFATIRKQQRYCGDICGFRAKKKATFKAYLEGKERDSQQSSKGFMYGAEWARDSDLGGLSLGKERYYE